MLLIACLGVVSVICFVQADVAPTEAFSHKQVLDKNGNYILYWKSNTTHITFEVHAKTRGYVGFGISPNGKMYPSDVVVGWVENDGTTHLKDCHTVGHSRPVVDSSQDWTLLHGEENSFGTTLKFVRPLKSCDTNDIEITDDTAHVIYAYHPDDPSSFTSLSWHGASRRGAQSLLLLSGTNEADTRMPSDVKTFDFVNRNYHVPGKDTMYHCTSFQLPDLDRKHHMIKYDPIITPGNELNVHHFILYSCVNHMDRNLAGHDFDCYHHRPKEYDSCYLVFIAWAIGGETFYFPQNTGMSLGNQDDPSFFLLETHYDNPALRTDMIDSSGIRIYYTPTLRQHDAGMLETGVQVNKLQFVPPHEDDFVSTGFCTADSLRTAMQSHPDGINVFGVLQHSHLLGRAIKTRIVNNGIEKEPLAVDNHYDFDYQEIRKINPERKVVPGDGIIVDCHYNSSHKSSPTFGGLTTRDEMCLSFILYYPKLDLEICTSAPSYDQIDRHPGTAVHKLMTWNWRDQAVRDNFNQVLRNSSYHKIVAGKHTRYANAKIQYISPVQKYVPPTRSCLNSTHVVQAKVNTNPSSTHHPVTHQHHVTQTTLMNHATGRLTPTEAYTHKLQLDADGDYVLYWKVNKTHITFETLVKTTGYIGFGISPNGKMYPADVVVGWVADDGTPHLHDYHTVQHVAPVFDQSQDWVLLHGAENNNGTILKFARKLDTCDSDDIKITDDTTHVIYSYHPRDPQSATSLSWHGASRRGAKSMLLLSGPKEANMVLPSDVKTFDFLNENYHVPGKDTTYHCTSWQFPKLSQKHHMIKYEPIITPGNEMNVHHILIYHCMHDVDPSLHGRSYECHGHQRVKELSECYSVFLGWAIGGQAFYFPPTVGMSLGTSRDPSFFVMETHYDNPLIKTDMIDNSGIRIYFTPTTRQYDAGMLEAGAHVNKLQFVPPFENDFISSGYCSENCLRKGVPPAGVKVFGILQHAHLLGRKIKTRIIRNGIEQKPLASDDHYDFNYQDFRLLKEERVILPGDGILVDCTYDSSHRMTPTYGGLSTQEEMCLSFVMYYPRMDVEVCDSSPKYENISTDPFQAVNHLNHWHWNDPAVRQKFNNVLQNTRYYTACAGRHLTPTRTVEVVRHIQPRQTYVDPHTSCPVV